MLLLLLLLQFNTTGMLGVANCSSFHEALLPNWAIHAWGRPWPVGAFWYDARICPSPSRMFGRGCSWQALLVR